MTIQRQAEAYIKDIAKLQASLERLSRKTKNDFVAERIEEALEGLEKAAARIGTIAYPIANDL